MTATTMAATMVTAPTATAISATTPLNDAGFDFPHGSDSAGDIHADIGVVNASGSDSHSVSGSDSAHDTGIDIGYGCGSCAACGIDPDSLYHNDAALDIDFDDGRDFRTDHANGIGYHGDYLGDNARGYGIGDDSDCAHPGDIGCGIGDRNDHATGIGNDCDSDNDTYFTRKFLWLN